MTERSPTAVHACALLLLVGGCAALYAYLLTHSPYDGLYGQDSYAYYYGARALWEEWSGRAPQPWALFSSQGFRWPVGYHLHIIAPFLLGIEGTGGGRALTLLMALAVPALVYRLVCSMWAGAPLSTHIVAGLVAGGLLPLAGAYTRTGLSLMADVPALFWSLLALLYVLKAVAPDEGRKTKDEGYVTQYEIRNTQSSLLRPSSFVFRPMWAAGGGGALGVATLVRYGSILLVVPIAIYLALSWYRGRHGATPTPGRFHFGRSGLGRIAPSVLAFALAFVAALSPQAAYTLTHESGAGYSYGAFLSDWNLANIFASTATSADGTATFAYPMFAFYFLSPLVSVGGGFLSPLLIPAFMLGLWTLLREKRRPVVGLLLGWWLVPALFFSGTPYQAHRFVLFYLPALTIFIGVGCARAAQSMLEAVSLKNAREQSEGHTVQSSRSRIWGGVVGALLLVGLVGGAWQGWRSTQSWIATHAAFKEEEVQVVELAREAAGVGVGGEPRAVCFGFSPALYHYTQWPILDFYIHDKEAIESFLGTPGPHIIVLPQESMATQWAGTPSAARWEWMKDHYDLHLQGTSGTYTVYRVLGVRN